MDMICKTNESCQWREECMVALFSIGAWHAGAVLQFLQEELPYVFNMCVICGRVICGRNTIL